MSRHSLSGASRGQRTAARARASRRALCRHGLSGCASARRPDRADWRADPADLSTFDHLLRTRHGALDVVPEIAGAYADLRARAVRVELDGLIVWVESVADQLATLTVPRRRKDVERVRALRAIERG